LTRLVSDQVRNIPGELAAYDLELKNKTGFTLREIAMEAAGLRKDVTVNQNRKVAVVPITAGQGTISCFVEAVSSIAAYLDFDPFITSAPDAAGLAEAYQEGADLVIMADDYLYAAVNLKTRRVINNDQATAAGYCIALSKMAGGLKEKRVLLIGAGPVGRAAADLLVLSGARLIIYDIDREKEKGLAELIGQKYKLAVSSGLNLEEALSKKPIIFDASPGHSFIKAKDVNAETMVAAPGIPLGLDSAALEIVKIKLIHDHLQIGTAVMLFSALV
jgi:pyrrolysine biosynthesis protein PylD